MKTFDESVPNRQMVPKKKRTLNILSLKRKTEILEYARQNPTMQKKKIAERFKVPRSTLSDFLKNRHEIESKSTQRNVETKRVREGKFPRLEKALFRWFSQLEKKNIISNGPLLKEQATKLARKLGITTFTPSGGWLHRFRSRHQILARNISDRKKLASNKSIRASGNDTLPEIIKDYSPSTIYNAKELGLYFNLLPDSNMVHNSESTHGEKPYEEQITVLLCCNADGSDKLPPLVIRKPNILHCFNNLKKSGIPCEYRDNIEAKMTSVIFKEWVELLDAEMALKNKKILLLVDSCPAHKWDSRVLSNVRIIFLPSNSRSLSQPLDHGIIKLTKHFYRQRLMRRLLRLLDCSELSSYKDLSVNLFQAMHLLVASWQDVKDTTVKNCFREAGVNFDGEANFTETGVSEVPDVTPEEFATITTYFESKVTLDQYLTFDDDLEVSVADNDDIDDLIENTHSDIKIEIKIEDPEEEEEYHSLLPAVTVCDAQRAVDTLRNFLGTCENYDEKLARHLIDFETLVTISSLKTKTKT